jgi:UPF0716 family protein affecting phage T7 exclusion
MGLLILGYLALEVLLLVAFAAQFGGVALVGLLVGGFLLGLLVMRIAGLSALQKLRSASAAQSFDLNAPDGSMPRRWRTRRASSGSRRCSSWRGS